MLWEDVPDYQEGTPVEVTFQNHRLIGYYFGKDRHKNEETGKIEEIIEFGTEFPKRTITTTRLYISSMAEITQLGEPRIEDKLDEEDEEQEDEDLFY